MCNKICYCNIICEFTNCVLYFVKAFFEQISLGNIATLNINNGHVLFEVNGDWPSMEYIYLKLNYIYNFHGKYVTAIPLYIFYYYIYILKSSLFILFFTLYFVY